MKIAITEIVTTFICSSFQHTLFRCRKSSNLKCIRMGFMVSLRGRNGMGMMAKVGATVRTGVDTVADDDDNGWWLENDPWKKAFSCAIYMKMESSIRYGGGGCVLLCVGPLIYLVYVQCKVHYCNFKMQRRMHLYARVSLLWFFDGTFCCCCYIDYNEHCILERTGTFRSKKFRLKDSLYKYQKCFFSKTTYKIQKNPQFWVEFCTLWYWRAINDDTP